MLEGHFWYSQLQFDYCSKNLKNYSETKCIIEGTVLTYTVMSEDLNHSCNWPDMHYLGYGRVYSINGVKT